MNGPARRVASVVLAGAIGLLAPGVTPLAAAEQPGADSGGSWRPPPPNIDARPDGNGGQPLDHFEGKPFDHFEKTTECITASDDLSKGKLVQRIPWAQQYLRLDEVHELMKATTPGIGIQADDSRDPVTVAVIDTGVTQHPWLDVVQGGDYIKGGDGLTDCDGHGTLVAGIIAADTPSHIGFNGVAPDARIFSVRQSSSNFTVKEEPEEKDQESEEDGDQPEGEKSQDKQPEQGGDKSESHGAATDTGAAAAASHAQKSGDQDEGVGDLASLANAVVFAADTEEVGVMNISIDNCNAAGSAASPGMAKLHAAISYAVNKQDVVVVASAGNKGGKCKQNNELKPNTIVAPPWFAKDVLSVAAIDKQGGVAEFSMHGPWVSVAAPGTKILSLDPAEGSTGLANRVIENDKPQKIQGTSYAAPYVAGLVALVRAKYPNKDAHEVMRRIEATAQHPAAPGGRSQYVGHGVINPMAALTTSVTDVREAANNSGPVPADLPAPADRNWTPIVVALGGAGGALAALLITLFTVHTVRRNRREHTG